jgi:hypothetical protein
MAVLLLGARPFGLHGVYGPGLTPATQDFRADDLDDAQALTRAYASLGGESSPVIYMDFFGYLQAWTAMKQHYTTVGSS